jgi:uncharacterized protein (TIGR02453 family)
MTGFPQATLKFLKGLAAHNDKAWFEAHRADYDQYYIGVAREFVEAIGPALSKVAPDVRYDPRVNGSISRINRDIRFSKDKRPYKDHLDLWFWHGERRGWNLPGFYLRIAAERVWLGGGMHGFEKDQLERYRDAVTFGTGAEALRAAVAKVQKAGPYEIGGASRKTVPKGYDASGPGADFLLHEGLYAGLELPGEAALEPDFDKIVLKHFKATWPLSQWLIAEVGG